jgi:hypothetical protein
MLLEVRAAALVVQVAHPTVPVVVTVPPVSGELNTILVTVPLPGGADHVPSPRQKVEALALTPPARLVTGKFPVTSAARFTAAKLGRPAALPCNNVVVVPVEAKVCSPCDPLPTTMALAVRALELVVQVEQEIVPDVVIVPPDIGEVVAMELTVPLPAGVAHMPSPLQNVDDEASVPLFR